MGRRPRWELQDCVFLGYLGIVITLLLVLGVGYGRHAHPWPLIAWHVLIGALGLGARRLPLYWDHPLARWLRWWYPILLCTFCFEALGKMIHLLRPELIDASLVAADRFVFGRDMTPWLQSYASVWLTELMYFCYASYYFFMPGVGFPLYLRGPAGREPGAPFREFMLAVSLTFWVCYLHFLFTPAGGPVFWPDYPGGVQKLPGGPITAIERWVFENGTIVGGAFPSSHVAVALAATWHALRFRVAPWFFAPVFIGLAVSTMYNGYHYGVDVLYGIVVGAVMLLISSRLFLWRERRLGRLPAAAAGGYPPYSSVKGID